MHLHQNTPNIHYTHSTRLIISGYIFYYYPYNRHILAIKTIGIINRTNVNSSISK